MDLLWPGFLVFLAIVPILIAAYLRALRRRRAAIRYSSLSLIRAALPRYSRLKRHLPAGFFIAGLASLVIGLGRPVSVVAVPTDQTMIILAVDVSRSMCLRDVLPNRLEAAQAAAIAFIESQRAGAQIGIVAFSGFAEVIQAPTRDQTALRTAIESLVTGRRTAIGSAILKAVDLIAEVDETVAPSVRNPTSDDAPPPVPEGVFVPNIIVLLTDGASNIGPLPLEAAQQAADRGIRVYTIGFGADGGNEFPQCPTRLLGSEPLGDGFRRGMGGMGGGGFGPGGRFPRGIDEEALKGVAALTDAAYYSAESADELQAVFSELPTNLIMKHEMVELSAGFTAFGALLAAASLLLAFRWNPLLP
ncbi:MAG: VWA domain-containing protein [Anaerolineae bacterium]|nr:VWA domain-containing protein [Anaerolineae bacterium]